MIHSEQFLSAFGLTPKLHSFYEVTNGFNGTQESNGMILWVTPHPHQGMEPSDKHQEIGICMLLLSSPHGDEKYPHVTEPP